MKEYIWILKNINNINDDIYFTSEEKALNYIQGIICNHNRIKKYNQKIKVQYNNEIISYNLIRKELN